MSSAEHLDESAEYRLTALPGYRAAYVLATWGLVSLLPGATLRFEGEGVPVVDDGDSFPLKAQRCTREEGHQPPGCQDVCRPVPR